MVHRIPELDTWLQKHNAVHLGQGDVGKPSPLQLNAGRCLWVHHLYAVRGYVFIVAIHPEHNGWNIYTSAIVEDWSADRVWSVPKTLQAVETAWERELQAR